MAVFFVQPSSVLNSAVSQFCMLQAEKQGAGICGGFTCTAAVPVTDVHDHSRRQGWSDQHGGRRCGAWLWISKS